MVQTLDRSIVVKRELSRKTELLINRSISKAVTCGLRMNNEDHGNMVGAARVKVNIPEGPPGEGYSHIQP